MPHSKCYRRVPTREGENEERDKIDRLTTRRELTGAVRQHYQAADRAGKKVILDEFTQVTGYHRKHAIRVLTTQRPCEPKTRAVRRVYQEAVKEALIVLWEAADRICGKRLKTLLPLLVEAMERHGHLQLEEGIRTQLLAMSASTIDRQLHLVRERARGGRKRSSATNRVRKIVAVRTFADWEQPLRPGFMEMDLVTHCGPRAEGSFVHTLVLTDVASAWTECVALPVREQALVVEAISGLRPKLPFALLGLDTDNDSAFMNDTLYNYCREQNIVFTRSRAYHKNDQAWVEQKNGAIVRKLIGYGRLEGLTATAALRRVYEASRLYINFFQPSFKLKSKYREGARVHKQYELPDTPYRRLLAQDNIAPETKKMLKQQMESLDPVLLLKHISGCPRHRDGAQSEPNTGDSGARCHEICEWSGDSMARRRSAANSSARAKARTLVADTARPFCRSLAGLVELVGGKAGHGSQRDAEAITGKRLW